MSGDPARRAERHVGHDVVAVRTQHRLIGLDLVLRFMQQRKVQTESKQKKCYRGDSQMDGQLQYLWNAGDVDKSQCGVDGQDRRGEARQGGANKTRVLVNLVGRAGEPQRSADEPAHGRGGQRDRHPADACLDDERADGTGASHQPGGELRGQPGQGCCRGEGERPERTDHEAVHGLSRRRPQQAHHHHGHQHREHAPDRDNEPLSSYPARRDPGAQRHAVRVRDDRAGQQYPPDAEPDAQRRREKQCARGHIAEDVGLPQVHKEQQRKAE